MKFIRFLLNVLALAILLVVILAVAAFVPAIQTWVAQMALPDRPGFRGSIGSLSAGFGKVEIVDLRLEMDGAVLTLPSLRAALPLTTAARKRKAEVRSLVAKGWTLDLARNSAAGVASATAEPSNPAQRAAQIFGGLLRGEKLPCEVSFDGVDLEGDILVAALPGKAPVRLHLVIKGGGLGAGREGGFGIEAASEVMGPEFRIIAFSAHGRLAVAMDTPRSLQRVAFKGDVSAEGGSLPKNLSLSADLEASRVAGAETYALGLSRAGRQLAGLLVHSPDPTLRLAGSWKVDLHDSDLTLVAPDRPLPSFALTGAGDFDSDAAFARVHAAGRLKAVAGHLGVLIPALERWGQATLDSSFDLSRTGESVRVDRLSVSIAGDRPAVTLQALQPFDCDESTGKLKPSDPHGDLMEATIQGFPLAWLSGLPAGFAFTEGEMTGQFVVRAAEGGFALRQKTPLTATHVSLVRGAGTLARDLDLSLSLLADCDSQKWQAQWAPFTVSRGGRQLISIEGKASRQIVADEPIAIAGTWKSDFAGPDSRPLIPGLPWLTGRSASGSYSASLGTSNVAEGSLALVGLDPNHSLTASVRANFHSDGSISFYAPFKIAFGPNVSEIGAEGTWRDEEQGPRLDLRLTGENVALDHVRLFAAPLASAEGGSLPAYPAAGIGGPGATPAGRDRNPFWGDWRGRLTVAFDRLRAGDRDLSDVSGTFDVDRGSVRLENGRGGLPRHPPATMEGTLSFDPAAEFPYSLKATAAATDLDAARLFAAPKAGEEPMIEGHFSIAATLTGKGIDLPDLIGRAQEEFKVTSASTGGIIRLLKTSVAEAIPQVSTPVKDTVGSVGSFVASSLFGLKGPSIDSNKNPVSKNADAVLNFTTQVSEIGYDQIAITGIRGSDGTIRLVDIAMTAPDERLTGSGQITYVKGLPLAAQPLSMELQLGARGGIADLLKEAGLLSTRKDSLGYALLGQSVHFGGTLQQIDESQWHDLLVKAATRKPEPAKKGG